MDFENFVGLARFGLEARREELRPAVAEFKRVERALQALDELDPVRSNSGSERRATPQPRRKYLPPELRRAQVLDLLTDRPEAYRRIDVAEALGITKARAGQIVHGLIADHLVEERGGGTLAITEKARRILQGRHPEKPSIDISHRGVIT